MLVLGHVLVRRLVDHSLATEELRLTGTHDQHDHNTEQDQPNTEDQYESDTTDARTTAIIRARTVYQCDDEDQEQSESAEQREQELENEVVEVSEQLVTEEPEAAESR
jgi:hypothetical protein